MLYALNKGQILYLKEDTRFSEYVVDNALEDRNYEYDETEFKFAFTIEHYKSGVVENLDKFLWFEAKIIIPNETKR